MADYHVRKETSIKASPEAVFGIVGDLSRHQALAGSGELVTVRTLTQGPTGLGTIIEADESIHLGDQHMEFSAKSVVVKYEPPNVISWMPVPPIPVRRIQWWFHVTPEGQGSKVVNEVEVDLGDATEMMGGVEAYKATRGVDIATGMAKTLENLRQAAEK